MLFFMVSCSKAPKHGLHRRKVSEYYVNSGFVQYLLPELPAWANFSTSGNCRRSRSTRYLDFEKLAKSYNLTYAQNVQFQYMFNKEFYLLSKNHKLDFLLFKDEEKLFYQVADKIQTGINAFRVPRYHRVHLIWIDPALGSEDEKNKLKALLNSKIMDRGHPVFVSLCLGAAELVAFMTEMKLKSRDIRLLPMELFSPYDTNGVKRAIIGLDFSQLLGEKKEIIFFLPNGRKVKEFFGNYKIKKY